ncbi:MAG: hypothetical protein SGARI_000191 [Bacillariaceae sp.]
MKLENLSEKELSALLAHLLRLDVDSDDIKEFSALICDRTHGNVFFVMKQLEELQDAHVLLFCPIKSKWKFSIEECRSKMNVTNNVAKLLSSRIGQLSRNSEQLLKLVSCFDSQVSPSLLEATKEVLFIFDEVASALEEACDEKLLIYIDSQDLYKMSHDEVHAAAYDLLPSGNERRMIHFDLGMAILKSLRKMPDDKLALFACADQFTKAGVRMLRRTLREKEILKVVNLFISTGKEAGLLFAHQPADDYIKTAADLLGAERNEIFDDHNELATKLFLLRAKTSLRANRIKECRECAESVISHTHEQEHKRAAQLILIKSYSSDNLLGKQADYALPLLDSMGHGIVACTTMRKEKVMKQAFDLSDGELLALPMISDKEVEFCIEITCELIQSAIHLAQTEFVCPALISLLSLTLEHGACRYTPLIFALIGQIIIAETKDLEKGLRFIELGLRSEYELDLEVKSRVLLHTCMGLGCIQPISKCMYLALDGFETGMSAGSIATAFNASAWYLLSFFYSGMPIRSLLQDAEKFILQME